MTSSSILERTIRYTPLNEQRIRGIVQRAIETGRVIEQQTQKDREMIQEIRDIRLRVETAAR